MVDAPARALPVVAVVGRPNVGKSSLVNRVIGRREAIVEETPGVTRDRRGFTAEWAGRSFEIVDTGGLEPGAEGLEAQVAEQAQVAIETADLILLVVDASAGPNQDDLVVADMLRRSGKPVIVAANKVDDPRDEPVAAAFYRLGLGDPVPLSALHGRGSGDLLEAVIKQLPGDATADSDTEWGSVAIVGRPNVGKSSILNALLGEERAIVDARPGTTRDPVDSYIDLPGGRRLRLVDTAGMRRHTHIADPIEYFGFLRSRQTLTRVDAAVLVIDASEGVAGLDQRLAQEIATHGRACVLTLNKWDLVTKDETDRARLERWFGERLRFLDWATVIRTSAVTSRGIDKIVPTVEAAIASHRRRLPTPVVNRIVQDAQARRPHRRSGGRQPRILYAVQPAASPPMIALFVTAPLERAYLRYIENRIREEESFSGSPIKIETRIRRRDHAR